MEGDGGDGGDEALHHDDQHLGARDLVLGQPSRPTGNLLTALLASYQGSDEVNDPVQYEACGVMDVYFNKKLSFCFGNKK